jgi:hypothetical protein
MIKVALKIHSPKIRATLESSRVAATVSSSRPRATFIEFSYRNPNFVLVLDDYFAEDYMIDYCVGA